ncbi:MAG TPA: phage protein Gp27 family protein [Rariglobus sp.]|nr:phage protein Gp27 family protein [Rariglobus sp.]
MGNLAENNLSGPELRAMLDELYQLSGNPTLAQIQAAMAKRGITASHESARSVKKKNFAEYLAEVKRAREIGQLVAEAGADPETRTEAAAVMLSEQITDQILRARMEGRDIEADVLEKTVLNVTRLTASFRDGKKLKADLRALEQKLVMQQFDAAKAVLEHAKEIRLIIADNKLDAAAKTERVAKVLWGQKPADFKAVGDKGGAST